MADLIGVPAVTFFLQRLECDSLHVLLLHKVDQVLGVECALLFFDIHHVLIGVCLVVTTVIWDVVILYPFILLQDLPGLLSLLLLLLGLPLLQFLLFFFRGFLEEVRVEDLLRHHRVNALEVLVVLGYLSQVEDVVHHFLPSVELLPFLGGLLPFLLLPL